MATAKELKDVLKKMVKFLTKYSSVFKDLDFKLSSLKECNGSYYVESRLKPKIEFWIVENEYDNVKKKSSPAYNFCIAYEISESLSNEDIVDCLPSIWWIGNTGKLDKNCYNQVIFEYDDVDLEKNVDFKKFMNGKEKKEFEQANKCLKIVSFRRVAICHLLFKKW